MDELPADLDQYKFIEREQKLVRKGNDEPPLKSFALVDLNGTEHTQSILNEPAALLLFFLHTNDINEWLPSVKEIYETAKRKNYPVFFVSPDAARSRILLSSAGLPDLMTLNCDQTAIRTAARTNPTYYYIRSGRVVEKWTTGDTEKVLKNL
jgi:hypothetical protein